MSSPWTDPDPALVAAKDAVRLEMMGVGDIDLRAKRAITVLWQLGWRPVYTDVDASPPTMPPHEYLDASDRLLARLRVELARGLEEEGM